MPDRQVETSRILNLLRGGVRGLTADAMGTPVDLATDVANLGIAGYGYGAHKLGLIDSPPDLLEKKNVPFSSDWLAKGTPLEEKEGEGGGYDAARLATGILPAFLRGNVGRTPVKDTSAPRGSPEAQRGAIYLDKQGELLGKDIAVTHATRGLAGEHMGINTFGGLISDEEALEQGITKFPAAKNELSNISFAATTKQNAGDLRDTGYGRNIIVPHPHAFDPKRTNTYIYPHDAGTFTGMVDPKAPKDEQVYRRLVEKLDPTIGKDAWIEDKYYKSIPEWLRSKDADRMRIPQDDYASSTHNEKLTSQQAKLIEALRLREIGSNQEIYPGRFINDLKDPKNWANYESKYGKLKPDQIDFYVSMLRDYDKARKIKPEAYHEVKRYGTMPLNKENVSAYITDTQEEQDFARKYLKPRGVELVSGNSFRDPGELHDFIRDVQTHALRRGR